MDGQIDFFEVPEDRRYWVVRAEGGAYFDHFMHDGTIAIGRLDGVDLPDDVSNFLSDLDKVESASRRKSARNGDAPSVATLRFNQLKRFIFEMSVGDWILTMRSNSVRFGRIVGHPNIIEEPITIWSKDDPPKPVRMPFRLRRKVEWGPGYNKSELPSTLMASLQAHQTVFNIDDKWEQIHHALYAAFRRGERFYLSAKICSERPVANIDLTNYLSFLSEIEFIGKELTDQTEFDDYESRFRSFVLRGEATLSTKAAFQSPGEIAHMFLSALDTEALKTAGAIFAVYAMLFGNKLTGMEGIMPTSSREQFWKMVIDRMSNSGASTTVEKYDIKLPSSNTTQLESAELDEPTLAANDDK